MTEFMTADWSPLGDVYYRKYELYSMEWKDHMKISDFTISCATYGGPIATMRNAMSTVRSDAKQFIRIYNAAGKKLKEFVWQEGGQLMYIGWTSSEKLLCVQDDGTTVLFNVFGEIEMRFDMGEEASDLKLMECKVFPSYHDSGLIVMTTAYRFWMRGDINRKQRARKLADIPGLSSPPSSWTVIARDNNMSALVAKDAQLYLIDQLGQCQYVQDVPIDDPNPLAFVEMAVSMNGKYLALFTASGTLWIGSVDLEARFCELDTKTPNRPSQLCWCGGGAVLVHWPGQDVLMVGPEKDWIKYAYDGDVVITAEPDGVRIITEDIQEFIQRVPEETDKIFRIGSMEPGAMLFEAEREFRNQNKKANEYIRSIEGQIDIAVEQCIEAAGHEYEPANQKDLLRAAMFGKGFVNTLSPDTFYNMCQMLRVLNAIRDYTIGIPLTYKQLLILQLETVVDRLVYRRHYALARKICQYLKLKDSETRILTHWACYKVEHDKNVDARVAASIQSKFGDLSSISYSDIALKAIERGRTDLAMMLLDHEPRADRQVPLLMKIERYESALRKAIDSGDSNLIYTVIFELKQCLQNMGDFLLEIRKSPTALSLLMKYYQTENTHLLDDLYQQEDRHIDVANCRVVASYEELDMNGRKARLRDALKKFTDAQDEWATKATENELLLLERQEGFEAQGIICLNKSLHDTMKILIADGKQKAAEQLRKDFKVPDRRFWWLKVTALAEAGNWMELEAFSKSKKSPIGYRPFTEACYKAGNKAEGHKYLSRVAPDEKVRCLISIGEMENAAETAFQRRNEDELNMVLQQCTISDRAIVERVARLKAQLTS